MAKTRAEQISGPRVYTKPALRERGITWSDKHLKTLEAKGIFPSRFRLGANTNGWNADAVDSFLIGRIRGGGPPRKQAPDALTKRVVAKKAKAAPEPKPKTAVVDGGAEKAEPQP